MNPKVSASARARQAAIKRRASERAASGSKKKFDYSFYGVLLLALLAGWILTLYKFLQPPPPYNIGIRSAPGVTLEDGRRVAVSEKGATVDEAEFHVLVLHDLRGSRLDLLPNVTQEELVNLKVRLVSYDRPGYGESDPHPRRTAQSEAEDIAQIASQLSMGDSFYVIGLSWGALPAYACLRYIPRRLKGVALVSPLADLWAPTMTDMETYESWMWMANSERLAILLARYAPGLLHLWLTQRVVRLGVWGGQTNPALAKVGEQDKEVLGWESVRKSLEESMVQVTRQGPVESVYRDIRLAFRSWGFDMAELAIEGEESQFEGEVHYWQGTEDWVCPAPAAKFVTRVLPAVQYTEVKGKGHFFYFEKGWSLRILKELLGLSQTEPASTCSADLGGKCTS